jgi:plasmid stabilization system protein ParE
MKLRFLETAKAEFWEAATRYEQERESLGGEFAREISKALDRITDHPNAWRPLSARTRQCRTHRFPYAVVYQVKSDHVLVVAIMHLHREPESWRGRIPARAE